jgi:glycosyltransferase involved in cell wall biosynthesis
MMKIYLNKLNESWVVDRFRLDWYTNNSSISTEKINESNIIWIVSPWTWRKISSKQLRNKTVVCSIYHIDFDSFDDKEKKDFYKRDKFVDVYHVISSITKQQLELLTNKEIISIPFWVDDNLWFEHQNKNKLRDKYGLKENDFLIGSFQRDTEGSDLISPKLIKGPDIFLAIAKKMHEKNKNLKVILTGKRRQYLINNFEKYEIPFKYFEMINSGSLNELYNILDLYIVSSRVEGGPQAIMECAVSKVPIVSTNVGIAPEILSSKSLYTNEKDFFDAKADIVYAYKKSKEYTLKNGMNKYIKMFESVYEG